MASEVLTTTAGAHTQTSEDLYPAPGLRGGGNNCWLNAALQVVCNLSYLKEGVLNLKQPTSSELEEAARKAHILIVLSYFLISLGALLAVGSVYIAFVAHPVVAICAPILPVALGVLCHQQGQSQLIENPFKPLIDMVNRYETERQTALIGAVSSIDTQLVREWLFRATVNPKFSPDTQLITQPRNSQEDPASFFLYLFDVLNLRMPAIKSERAYYNNAKEIVGTSESMERPDSLLKLFIPRDVNKPSLSLDELLEPEFQFESGSNEKECPTAIGSRMQKSFVAPTDHLVIQFKRNLASYEAGQRSLDPLINTPITKLNHYQAKPPIFSEEAEYETDAFIIHGGSQYSGHYVAYVRDTGGNWWLMNDDQSTIVQAEEAMAKMPYCYLAFMNKKTPAPTE